MVRRVYRRKYPYKYSSATFYHPTTNSNSNSHTDSKPESNSNSNPNSQSDSWKSPTDSNRNYSGNRIISFCWILSRLGKIFIKNNPLRYRKISNRSSCICRAKMRWNYWSCKRLRSNHSDWNYKKNRSKNTYFSGRIHCINCILNLRKKSSASE